MDQITFQALPGTAAVYHLLKAGHVVYVGASTNVLARVGFWHRTAEFDQWRVFPCAADELEALEREHIQRYRPPMNRAGVTGPYKGGPVHGLTESVLEHGSPQAYLATRPALVSPADLRRAGLNAPPHELRAMPGFPAPVVERPHRAARKGMTYRWRRADVLAWFNEQDRQAAGARSAPVAKLVGVK